MKHHVYINTSMELEGVELTALGLARDEGHYDIIEMLESKNALELPPRNSRK